MWTKIGVMKMLSKEEKLLYSLSSIKEILEALGIDVEVTLTKNDNKYTINAYKEIEKCVVDYVKNLQPYKFEDLKKGMWVWDNKGLYCFECNPAISTDMAQCVTYNAFWYNCGEDEDEFFEEYDEFEEGRFFPVTKALEYQK